MTKESDVEAKGFCILIIYLALLLFSHSSHRYNVSRTKALLTLTIWPSHPRHSQSYSLDTKLCLLKRKRKKNRLFSDKTWSRKLQTDDHASPTPSLVYKEELGLQKNGWACLRNSWPCDDELHGENYWPLWWIVTFVWGSVGWLDCWHPWPMVTFVWRTFDLPDERSSIDDASEQSW